MTGARAEIDRIGHAPRVEIESPADAADVALTGATGFIGTAILSHLVEAGWPVRALHRPRAGRVLPSRPGLRWIAGDLGDTATVREFIAGTNAIIHCAGAVRGAGRRDFDRINLDGTRHLAEEAARQHPAPRFLLISSLAAREPGLSDYAASKRAGELAVEHAGDALRWTIVRPPAVYGPGDRELLPLFRAMARGFAVLPASAAGRFSLLHVDDLADAVVRWLATDATDRMTFELDDARPGGYDWSAIMDVAGRVLRPGRRLRRVPLPLRLLRSVAHGNLIAAKIFGYSPLLTPGKVRELTHEDWVCRDGGFARLTGWQPRYRLERGLAGMFPPAA